MDDLPHELLLRILQYLDSRSIVEAMTINKYFLSSAAVSIFRHTQEEKIFIPNTTILRLLNRIQVEFDEISLFSENFDLDVKTISAVVKFAQEIPGFNSLHLNVENVTGLALKTLFPAARTLRKFSLKNVTMEYPEFVKLFTCCANLSYLGLSNINVKNKLGPFTSFSVNESENVFSDLKFSKLAYIHLRSVTRFNSVTPNTNSSTAISTRTALDKIWGCLEPRVVRSIVVEKCSEFKLDFKVFQKFVNLERLSIVVQNLRVVSYNEKGESPRSLSFQNLKELALVIEEVSYDPEKFVHLARIHKHTGSHGTIHYSNNFDPKTSLLLLKESDAKSMRKLCLSNEFINDSIMLHCVNLRELEIRRPSDDKNYVLVNSVFPFLKKLSFHRGQMSWKSLMQILSSKKQLLEVRFRYMHFTIELNKTEADLFFSGLKDCNLRCIDIFKCTGLRARLLLNIFRAYSRTIERFKVVHSHCTDNDRYDGVLEKYQRFEKEMSSIAIESCDIQEIEFRWTSHCDEFFVKLNHFCKSFPKLRRISMNETKTNSTPSTPDVRELTVSAIENIVKKCANLEILECESIPISKLMIADKSKIRVLVVSGCNISKKELYEDVVYDCINLEVFKQTRPPILENLDDFKKLIAEKRNLRVLHINLKKLLENELFPQNVRTVNFDPVFQVIKANCSEIEKFVLIGKGIATRSIVMDFLMKSKKLVFLGIDFCPFLDTLDAIETIKSKIRRKRIAPQIIMPFKMSTERRIRLTTDKKCSIQ